MLACDAYVEKNFELWPGVLRLAAGGAAAHAAIDAAMDAARETASSLIADADLVARGSLDMLPRGMAARMIPDVARTLAHALGGLATDRALLPPLLVALPGAVCDMVLAAMREAGPLDFAMVALGDTLAFHREAGVSLPVLPSMPLVLGEFVRALDGGVEGGVALAGQTCLFPTLGAADSVAAQGKSAALAAFIAATMADAMTLPAAKPRRTRIVDPLAAHAWEGRTVAGASGLIPSGEIWEALSKGMKCASALREKRLLGAAAFALKGRGRTVGSIDGDRLVRFGVSEWR